jgi:protein TonB
MRLPLSLLVATALHGVLFGVGAVVLSRSVAKGGAPAALELEVGVIEAKPAPITDAAQTSATVASLAKPKAAPLRPRVAHHSRQVALVGTSAPLSTAPADDVGAPVSAAAAPPVSPSPAPAAARTLAPAGPGGGAALSAKPLYLSNPKPDYPIASYRRREEGIVLVNVLVQTDGTPSAISLNRSCGHPLLDRAALDAVRRWRFEPARAAGVAVSSAIVVHLRFSADDR